MALAEDIHELAHGQLALPAKRQHAEPGRLGGGAKGGKQAVHMLCIHCVVVDDGNMQPKRKHIKIYLYLFPIVMLHPNAVAAAPLTAC